MSSDQDIIDTIAAHRGRERGMVCDEGELWCDGCGCIIRDDEWPHHTLAALRERYEIVEKVTSDHDPFDILCAVNRGGPTKSDTICPRCRPAKEADQ